jgi:amino acid transporter
MINLEKIKPTIATAILLCCSNVFIVVLSVFLLNRALFFQLNLWQMLGITVGIPFPFLIANWTAITLGDELEKSDDSEVKKWAVSGMGTAFILSSLLPASLYLKDGLTSHFLWAGSIQLGVALGIFLVLSRKPKKQIPEKEHHPDS